MRSSSYRRRRDRLEAAEGHATAAQVRARVATYGNICYMCGGEADTVDHVKPIAKGGPKWPANLRPACRTCNSRKTDRWGPLDLTPEILQDAAAIGYHLWGGYQGRVYARGVTAVVDYDDLPAVGGHRWQHRRVKAGLIIYSISSDDRRWDRLGEVLMGVPRGTPICHLNHDPLDYRRHNLRAEG